MSSQKNGAGAFMKPEETETQETQFRKSYSLIEIKYYFRYCKPLMKKSGVFCSIWVILIDMKRNRNVSHYELELDKSKKSNLCDITSTTFFPRISSSFYFEIQNMFVLLNSSLFYRSCD